MDMIKTRIITKNDTQSNWEQSDAPLLSGEIALSFKDNDRVGLRVGNGQSWENAAKLELENQDQVVNLLQQIANQLQAMNSKLDELV